MSGHTDTERMDWFSPLLTVQEQCPNPGQLIHRINALEAAVQMGFTGREAIDMAMDAVLIEHPLEAVLVDGDRVQAVDDPTTHYWRAGDFGTVLTVSGTTLVVQWDRYPSGFTHQVSREQVVRCVPRAE